MHVNELGVEPGAFPPARQAAVRTTSASFFRSVISPQRHSTSATSSAILRSRSGISHSRQLRHPFATRDRRVLLPARPRKRSGAQKRDRRQCIVDVAGLQEAKISYCQRCRSSVRARGGFAGAPRLKAERSWGRRRESNTTPANYDLAALPLSYTGPRFRTLIRWS